MYNINKTSFIFFFVYILIIQWFCCDVAGCAGATFHRILVTLFFVILSICFLFYLLLNSQNFDFIFSTRIFYCQLLLCSIAATEKRRIRYIKTHDLSPTFTHFTFSPALLRRFTRKTSFATIALFLARLPVCRTRKDLRLVYRGLSFPMNPRA